MRIMTELTLELYLTIFLPVTFFIAGILIYYLRNIDKSIHQIDKSIGQIPEEFWRKFIDGYLLLQKSSSNPNPDRKIELLQKLKARTITPQESLELRNIMEQEAKAAQASQDLFRLILIIGIIIVIAMMLSEK